MSDHQIIYLEPVCTDCGEPEWPRMEGRLWCEDDVWGGQPCPECGERLPEAPRYVRASKKANMFEQLAKALPLDPEADKRVDDWLRRRKRSLT